MDQLLGQVRGHSEPTQEDMHDTSAVAAAQQNNHVEISRELGTLREKGQTTAVRSGTYDHNITIEIARQGTLADAFVDRRIASVRAAS